mgnify:CR=1 FL=1
MNYDFYGNAVEEYMRDYSESTTETLKKVNVDDEEIEYMIQKECNILRNFWKPTANMPN